KVSARIARKNNAVFVRKDFEDLGGYDQIGRILRQLATAGKLVRIGYGLYAKAKRSTLTGTVVPILPLPTLAKEALGRLGVEIGTSQLEKNYNASITTQVPTGRKIAIKGRVSRKIGYNGAYASYERVAR
ncbi:MAG: hypothetical protein L0H15_07240, partial [Nitrosospira sp.]|nr:hypothetical protein [Nitrosospira sp.]